MDLTPKTIDALGIPEKPLEVRHPKCTGLLLRVQPKTGLRTWYWEHRTGGRKHRIKLGRYPEMSISRAVAAATRARAALLDGKDPAADRRISRKAPRLSEIIDVYEELVLASKRRGAMAAWRLRAPFEALLDKRVMSIDIATITRWRADRKTTTLGDAPAPPGPKTINKDIKALHAMFNWAVRQGMIPRNPIKGIELEREDTTQEMRTLSADEERAVFEALESMRGTLPVCFEALVIVALDTGGRRGELLALRWTDVDLRAGRITLRGETTKSAKSRSIPLTPRAREALEALREHTDGVTVFGMSESNVFRCWAVVRSAAGCEAVRWHDLRHSFGTRLALAGVPSLVIKSLMGHSSLTVTEKYLHAVDTAREDAIARLVGP